jgi:putative pyruvate formate lyase activating enzyme
MPPVSDAGWLAPEELAERAALLDRLLKPCRVCPHACGVDRTISNNGKCCSGSHPIVSFHGPHFGEEPPISSVSGAGNIFFGNCNLRCVYCQNHQISQRPMTEQEYAVDCRRLADIMMELAECGCHNINLVSPTHFAPQIVRSLSIARAAGLAIPIVYNTNAFESLETLALLDGVVHVYLADLKYSDNKVARRCSEVQDYVGIARTAIREMYRQMGPDLIYDADGVLIRGLIIRLLVLPNDQAGVDDSLQFIHDELSPDVAISLMAQYFPTHRVVSTDRHPLLSRRINAAEWERAVCAVDRLGMVSGWLQDWTEAPDVYRPDFEDRRNPFKGTR